MSVITFFHDALVDTDVRRRGDAARGESFVDDGWVHPGQSCSTVLRTRTDGSKTEAGRVTHGLDGKYFLHAVVGRNIALEFLG